MPGQALPSDPPLSYGLALQTEDGVEAQRFGDSYSAHVQRGINHDRRRYQLRWDDITTTGHRALRDFFRDLGTDYIIWQPPDEDAELKFRVEDSGKYNASFDQYDRWNARVNIYQVFDVD